MSSQTYVTQNEYPLNDDTTLMSTTDLNSYMTHANDTFVKVSGYPLEELMGQPHNMVRHPDMPKQVFADMWATLKKGEPWTGLVKNRRKNGDYYWVRANAVPIVRDGHTIGYMSIRTKASAQETAEAQRLYDAMNRGTLKGRVLQRGLLVRKGLTSGLSLLKTLPLRWRVRLPLLAVQPLMALLLWGMALPFTQACTLFAVVALLCLLVAVWMEWQITRPLERLCQQALNVATGASHSVEHVQRADEIGVTLRAISQSGLMFRWLVNDVSSQVFNVRNGSEALARGNDDLNERTRQTATNVQQTLETMTHLASSVQDNTNTASEADKLSQAASSAAMNGGKAMETLIATMTQIASSTKEIGSITSLIDSIAFQTNILALNAAVEAARAGEQGKGFAVVAGEVRNLASRSATAASDIRRLIDASKDKVESGAEHVQTAERTMGDIVEQVKNVTQLIGQISTATVHQAQGLSDLTRAVDELDDITQQNAELVQAGAKTSATVKQQATRLVDAVAVFRQG